MTPTQLAYTYNASSSNRPLYIHCTYTYLHSSHGHGARKMSYFCKCEKCGFGANVSERTHRRHLREKDTPSTSVFEGDEGKQTLLECSASWTVLKFNTAILSIKSQYPGMPDVAVTDILIVFRDVLADANIKNNVNSNVDACKQSIDTLIPKTERIDLCVNECVEFVNDESNCQVCNESRTNANGKQRNSFFYVPLIPRLQTLYSVPEIAHSLTVHQQHVHDHDAPMADIWDSPRWSSLFADDGPFKVSSYSAYTKNITFSNSSF